MSTSNLWAFWATISDLLLYNGYTISIDSLYDSTLIALQAPWFGQGLKKKYASTTTARDAMIARASPSRRLSLLRQMYESSLYPIIDVVCKWCKPTGECPGTVSYLVRWRYRLTTICSYYPTVRIVFITNWRTHFEPPISTTQAIWRSRCDVFLVSFAATDTHLWLQIAHMVTVDTLAR